MVITAIASTFNLFFDAIESNVWIPISKMVGIAPDQIAFLCCMLSSYPFAAVHRRIRDPFHRHLFGIILGFVYGFLVYRFRFLNNILIAFVTYAIAYFGRAKSFTPWLVFYWSFGYLVCSNIYRMYFEYRIFKLDFTASLMISALKDVSFAFDSYDAEKDSKNKSFKFPSLIEYLGYIFFFPGFLAGPYFDFDEYRAFASLEMFKEFNYKIPFELQPILQVAGGLVLFGIMNLVKTKFPIPYVLSEEFDEYSFPQRIVYMAIALLCLRCMYYFAWFMCEMGCIISGLGYNGKTPDGKLKWDRTTNIRPLEWELSQNLHSTVACWNIRVVQWLKKYIYLRVRPGKKPGLLNALATFVVSAFWHGFYPGYYLFFLTLPLFFGTCQKALRNSVRTLFLNSDGSQNYPLKYSYDVVTMILTPLFLDYSGLSFALLSLGDTFTAWGKFYYFGHIICALIVVLEYFKLLPRKKIATPNKKSD